MKVSTREPCDGAVKYPDGGGGYTKLHTHTNK